MFQSTHPRGVRHGLHGLCGCDGKRFNPRTRVGCDAPSLSACRVFGRFNPRTRVGCDMGIIIRQSNKRCISIHAPAWGATFFFSLKALRQASFNPRTRVGCDEWPQSASRPGLWFQSTHPRGVRRGHGAHDAHKGRVSIHAPAWGATVRGCRFQFQLAQFQSTHPRGVRLAWESSRPAKPRFNHAPAWGATPAPTPPLLLAQGAFNPRTRVGCDAAG